MSKRIEVTHTSTPQDKKAADNALREALRAARTSRMDEAVVVPVRGDGHRNNAK